MIRSAEVQTDSDARQWEARLNREWPQRVQVAAWIGARISASSVTSPRVVELACGAGFLAEVLQRQLPGIRYCGFDLSPHLLDFARRRLDGLRSRHVGENELDFRCTDLVRDDWTEQVQGLGWMGKVDAVVSIQALHDLGGLEQQAEVLKRARDLLRDGGLLAYGDLLLDDENSHPSRHKAAQHEEMLRACGYFLGGSQSADHEGEQLHLKSNATARFGGFGCFACYK